MHGDEIVTLNLSLYYVLSNLLTNLIIISKQLE